MASAPPSFPGTDILRQLMTAAGIPSFRALRQRAGVSNWAIQQLRRGAIGRMRVEVLQAIATALHLSLADLLQAFMPDADGLSSRQGGARDRITALEQEYQRLQHQQQTLEATLRHGLQEEVVGILEPWMVQWPTAAHAVTQNPELPAARLLPLVKPVEQLLSTWSVMTMAPVGATVPYDPHCHQLMAGTANPGDPVRVRYAGYLWGDRLLHRAKVSPI